MANKLRRNGLRNQGATCYLNSVLQVLFMTPEVHEGLKRSTDRNTSTDDSDGVLKEVFDKLKYEESETTSITEHLQIKDVHRQRDAAECLELLLNRLSHNVSKPFHGTLTDRTECDEGHCIIEETTDFWTLPLALSDCRSVTEGFQKFFESQSFNVYCTKCKESKDAKTHCQMKTPPTVLVLLLKRFIIDPRNGVHYKSNCEVELSREIKTEGSSFSLCGVVDHRGSANGGHYTVSMKSQEDGNWHHFSDTDVRKTEEPTGQRSRTAYLLIYRALPTQRKEPPSKPQTDSEDRSFSRTTRQEKEDEQRQTPAPKEVEMVEGISAAEEGGGGISAAEEGKEDNKNSIHETKLRENKERLNPRVVPAPEEENRQGSWCCCFKKQTRPEVRAFEGVRYSKVGKRGKGHT